MPQHFTTGQRSVAEGPPGGKVAPPPGIVTNKKNDSQLFAIPVNNLSEEIKEKEQLILTTVLNNYFFSPSEFSQLLSKFEPLFRGRERYRTLQYFLDNKVATIPVAVKETGEHYQSLYRGVNWLLENGYLVTYRKVSGASKGGPKPTLYGIPGVPEKLIAEAVLKTQRSYLHTFKVIDQLTQRIWDDYKDEDIQFSKIVNLARRNCQGLQFLDVAELTAKELHRRGKKVWR